MVPFPAVEDCLGLFPKDSSMKIQDGYAVLAYDFDIVSTNTDCIYNIENHRAEKKLRMARSSLQGFDPKQIGNVMNNLQKQVDRMVKDVPKLPPLTIPGMGDVMGTVQSIGRVVQ